MSCFKLLSPAKINLFLHILRKREDGYHDLSMWMEKISLFDEMILEKRDEGIEITGAPKEIPLEKNLIFKAAKKLQEASACKEGVYVTLTKKIPMGGGLGGGSSNAATVLKGLNQLWSLNWPVQKLAEIGVQLGADVPFFLYDGPAKVEGIGEQIIPLKTCFKLWIILINPGVHVSTPWAYQVWDEKQRNELTQKNQSVSLPRTLEALVEVLRNDFEEVLFPKYPEIERVKKALVASGALGALMSGSGSSVFGIFGSKEKRDLALKRIEIKKGWQVFAVENVGAGGFEPPDAGIKIL